MKLRDSKTHVVTQGLVFRRALCLVSYSVATVLKVLGYESGALHFHFLLGPRSDEGSPAGSACLAHTHGQIESVPLRRFECFLMWNLLFIYIKFGTYDLNPTSRSVPLISPNFTFLPLYECLSIFACNFCLDDFGFCFKKQINQRTCLPLS